jgi:hypothetical protein
MKLKLMALVTLIPATLAFTPRPAAALGLGDFSGLVDSVSPLLGGVMTFDITPYTSILQKGNYSGAVNALTSTLGDYGIIDPAKLRDKSKVDIGNGVKVGFASGTDTREILSSINANKDIAAQVTLDGALGDEAQKDIIKRGEGTSDLVKASSEYSAMSGKTKISQKIMRNQSAQLAVLAGLGGQQLGEQRSQGVTLNLLTSIAADIRAQGNQDSRVKDGEGDRNTQGVIGSAAMFSSMLTPVSK